MANFPDNRRIIDTIKDRIDIVNLIGKYIELKPAGKNFLAICPFHSEKTPSFSVNPEMQLYKCFGCGRSGDIFSFLMEHEHMSFPEVLEQLADEAGVKLEKTDKKTNYFFSILEMIHRLATEFYVDQLMSKTKKASKALKYLHDRKFNNKFLKSFNIGYAPLADGQALHKYLTQKADFTEKQLLDSGLLKKKNGRVVDKFRNRIMFPIKNERGKVIAFTGRQMPDNDYGPKYLNSPETPLFHKKQNVYGIYESKRFIREEDLVILCEGSTDVIACHQIGVKNIVAPLGTALTIEQLNLIKKYTDNVLLLFDNDTAGQKALERGFVLGTELNLNVYATNTGKFKDLGDMVEEKPGSVSKIVTNYQDCFSYLLSAQLEDLDITQHIQYKQIVKYVGILLQNVSMQENLDFYLEKAQKLTGKSKEVFEDAINNAKKSTHRISSYTGKTPKNSVDSPYQYIDKDYEVSNGGSGNRNDGSDNSSRWSKSSKNKLDRKVSIDLEEYLLGLILHTEKYSMVSEVKLKFFVNESVKKVLKFLIKHSDSTSTDNQKEDRFLAKYFKNDKAVTNSLKHIFLDDELVQFVASDDVKQIFNQVYKRIKKRYYETQLAILRKELTIGEESPSADQKRIKSLLSDISEILEKLK